MAIAGPFLPAVANLTDQGGSPYRNAVYGGGSPAVLIALGVELQFLRFDAGPLAVGASAGFLGFDGQLGEAETAPSARFNIVPVQLGLGYRFDRTPSTPKLRASTGLPSDFGRKKRARESIPPLRSPTLRSSTAADLHHRLLEGVDHGGGGKT